MRDTTLAVARPPKYNEDRKLVAYRLPVRLVKALHSAAKKHRRPYTTELEIAIETYLAKLKLLPPGPPEPDDE